MKTSRGPGGVDEPGAGRADGAGLVARGAAAAPGHDLAEAPGLQPVRWML